MNFDRFVKTPSAFPSLNHGKTHENSLVYMTHAPDSRLISFYGSVERIRNTTRVLCCNQ